MRTYENANDTRTNAAQYCSTTSAATRTSSTPDGASAARLRDAGEGGRRAGVADRPAAPGEAVTELALVHAAARGDQVAFLTLHALYAAYVRQLAATFARCKATRQELSNECDRLDPPSLVRLSNGHAGDSRG